MTVGRVRGSDVLAVEAVLVGMSAALGVLAGALLTAGITGLDLRLGGLEEMAAATIPTAIVLVVASFFCGGWSYSALRERDRGSRYHDHRDHPTHRT